MSPASPTRMTCKSASTSAEQCDELQAQISDIQQEVAAAKAGSDRAATSTRFSGARRRSSLKPRSRRIGRSREAVAIELGDCTLKDGLRSARCDHE